MLDRECLGLERTANDGWSSLFKIDTMLVIRLDMSSTPRNAVTEAGKLY